MGPPAPLQQRHMVWQKALLHEIADGDRGVRRADSGVELRKEVLPAESPRLFFGEFARSGGRPDVHRPAPAPHPFAVWADLVLMPAQLPHAALIEQVALLL